MDKIEWCKRKEKGVRIIEPNDHIAGDYLRKSDDAIKVMATSPAEDWKIVGAYYACYDALYALLQKAGIKCEIHDCSIALMEFFGFSAEEKSFMVDLKNKRIDAQYYVNREARLGDANHIKDFVLKCKQIIHTADFKDIRREIIERLDGGGMK